MPRYRTQKARGVHLLVEGSLAVGTFTALPPKNSVKVIPYSMPEEWEFPLFARPCPVTPRHGFVESRMVHNYEELLNLWAEAVKVDPQSEILCMRRYTAKVSAMATDAGVVYGFDNDGVTSGKGEQRVIPCSSKSFTETLRGIDYSGTLLEDIPHGAYVELVEHGGDLVMVQIRNGPSVTSSAKLWVPTEEFQATHILMLPYPGYDLVKWEQMVLTQKQTHPQTVLWLPGHAMGSHYAVHGIAAGMAVSTEDQQPDITKPLIRPNGAPAPLDSLALDGIADSICAYERLALRETPEAEEIAPSVWPKMQQVLAWKMPDYVNSFDRDEIRATASVQQILTAVGTLHAMPLWGPETHLLRLRAFGAVTMARYLSAACIGEARHFFESGPGRDGVEPAIKWKRQLGFISKKGHSRRSVYKHALQLTLDDLQPIVKAAIRDFSGDWGGSNSGCGCGERDCEDCENTYVDPRRGQRSGSGYGGKKWRTAAKLTYRLLTALNAFKRSPTPEGWQEVTLAYNVAVGAAHNNGRLLDKFVSYNTVDRVVRAPQLGFCNPWAMRVVVPEIAPTPRPLTDLDVPEETEGETSKPLHLVDYQFKADAAPPEGFVWLRHVTVPIPTYMVLSAVTAMSSSDLVCKTLDAQIRCASCSLAILRRLLKLDAFRRYVAPLIIDQTELQEELVG